MTGLDQDMMQKNLSCKSLKDAQKNMYTYGFAFTPVNFLFLSLGVLLLILAEKEQIALPAMSDDILPMFCTSGILGSSILIFFTIASYTYGPLLGLVVFGLFTQKHPRDKFVPYICIASPLICFSTSYLVEKYIGYTFGYEMLMLNGLITFTGLWLLSYKHQTK